MQLFATCVLAWLASAAPARTQTSEPTPLVLPAPSQTSSSPSPLDLSGASAPAQDATAPAPASDFPRAHIEAVPDHAHIGEPIELTLVIEHAPNAALTLPDPHMLPRSLALIADQGLRRSDDPSSAGHRITRARWQVMALEGGDLSIPPITVTVDQGGKSTPLAVALPKVTIEAALQPGEDAPRPPRSFRETPTVHMWSLRGIVTALCVAIVAIVATVVVWKRRSRRKLIPVAAVTPLDRLATLEMHARAEPDAARNVIYALTALLRETVDARSNVRRNAMTDADWSNAIATDPNVPEAVRVTVARLLVAAERVKYAQESPSPLAVRDWMEQARKALEALAEPAKAAA
jgi:hypothetical protein